jgi:hypothetical protein
LTPLLANAMMIKEEILLTKEKKKEHAPPAG